ncbi:MAG TPA: hypothetical protein VFR09_09340 [Alphaproteobacteria bacterium]|nr:hypothetical protein [Alphaproteobacteria bacterium]
MPGEVFIEYTQVGAIVRVTAVDAETGTEAIFQAPANSSQADLQRMAVNKLNYVMQKQKK